MTNMPGKQFIFMCGLMLMPIGAMASSDATSALSSISVTAHTLANWRAGAEHGYGPDQYRLGLAYATGDGVPQNLSEAAYWWRKSADNLYPQAELMMGNSYAHGWGVSRDINRAIHWWKIAARSEAADVARRAQFLLDSAA
ncbi:tetratricopeptide repeat protein [Acidithiobacillus sp.]|uniref:tetratricopeptide repeat protein n=1 Tax=Acidithiobacillus sp. TaxID=1872118 RepID=UPI00261D2E04|nr:tetratricopeptide repeat protein [Acidithiobacillus sp.]MDD5278098.1 tetratricopeptide repeat protein [Acidithiobacillus sp.]